MVKRLIAKVGSIRNKFILTQDEFIAILKGGMDSKTDENINVNWKIDSLEVRWDETSQKWHLIFTTDESADESEGEWPLDV